MNELSFSDADLASRICAGDKRAEAELCKRYELGVRQILLRATGNVALVHELSQECFIVTLKRLRAQPLEDPAKLPAFVAQVARNLALAENRKQRRRRTDTGHEASLQDAASSTNQECEAELASAAAAVRAVLQELKSSRDRSLLVRYYLHDEDKQVICRELGLSEPTFDVALFRARSRFLALLHRRGISKSDLFSWGLL